MENSHASMHVDNTNITVGSDNFNNLEETLNREMSNIHQLLLSNKFNIKRRVYMVIGTHQRFNGFWQDRTILGDLYEVRPLNIWNLEDNFLFCFKKLFC